MPAARWCGSCGGPQATSSEDCAAGASAEVGVELSQQPRILDAARNVRFERRYPPPPGVDRVAFVAHWSPGERQSRSVSRLIAELQRLGYWVVLSSTSEAPGEFEFHPE